MSLSLNDTLTRSTTYTTLMNTLRAPEWLPSFLVPFVTLSYPVERPAEPDSFHNASYYGNGPLDFYFIVSCIAVMAILRDCLRLMVCEPFAKWYLTQRLRSSKATSAKTNGHANGHAIDPPKSNGLANGNGNGAANGHAAHANGNAITKREARQLRHSVIRFAEQGWPFLYYTAQFAYGVVSGRIVICVISSP